MIADWFKSLALPKLPQWLVPLLVVVVFFSLLLKAYHFGVAVEHGRNAAAENARVAALGEKVLQLQTEKIETEKRRARDMQALALNHQQELKQHEQNARNALAAYRSGAVSLRIPAKVQPAVCAGFPAAAGITSGGGDAVAGAELSESAAEFLISEAARADAIVAQLNACQAIIQQDRSN